MTPEESTAWRIDLPGGSFDILPFFRDFALPRVPEGGSYLEVGSFFGRSACFVGLERPDIRITVVDPWADTWEDAGEQLPVGPDRERRDKYGGMFEAFLAGVKEHAPELLTGDRPGGPLVIRRGFSRDVLPHIPDHSVDFSFLDGDHTLQGLKFDVASARRITKPGGLIGGHDLHCAAWNSPTTQAVREELVLRPGAKGYKLAPWPYEREGWEPGHSSVWFCTDW